MSVWCFSLRASLQVSDNSGSVWVGAPDERFRADHGVYGPRYTFWCECRWLLVQRNEEHDLLLPDVGSSDHNQWVAPELRADRKEMGDEARDPCLDLNFK